MPKSNLLSQILSIIKLARPLVLLSTFSAWLLGVAISFGLGYEFKWNSFFYGLTSMLLASSSIHFVNEYADYETDALTKRTFYSGGSGIIQSGNITRQSVLHYAVITALAALTTQNIAIIYGYQKWETILILVAGIIGGWIYSLPPSLAWRGLGEAWNTLLVAWLLPFYGFVQMSRTTDTWVLLAVLPVTFLAFNNLLGVTWPDRAADQAVGKKTLATRLEPSTLRKLYLTCTILSFATLLVTEYPSPVFALSLIAYPLSAIGWRGYTKKEGAGWTVSATHTLIVAQIVAWLYHGLLIP